MYNATDADDDETTRHLHEIHVIARIQFVPAAAAPSKREQHQRGPCKLTS
jgi:hypothetical protein